MGRVGSTLTIVNCLVSFSFVFLSFLVLRGGNDTFEGPSLQNTKILRQDPQEREERMKIVAGEGKEKAKFWAVWRGGGGGRSGRGGSRGEGSVEKKEKQKKKRPQKGPPPPLPLPSQDGSKNCIFLIEMCLPCVCCLIQTGHPQPSCYSGPSVLWVSFATGWHRGQRANPYLLHCCTAEPVLTRATKHTPSVKHM